MTSAASGIVKSGRKKFEYVQESGKDNDEKLGKWQQQLKQRLGRPPNPEVTIGGLLIYPFIAHGFANDHFSLKFLLD